MRILLVEDSADLALWLVSLLREQGFEVDHLPDGAAADSLLRQASYDAVLLDLNLPGLAGKGVLRRLRERGNDVALIVLTASASLDQKVQCLEIGADDYIIKPVESRELVARLKAVVRRRLPGKSNDIACGDLRYELNTRRFTLSGQELALPPRERSLLEALMIKAGSTVPKQTLIDSMFGMEDEAGASADALDLYLHRLRRKLEHSQAAIITLRGVGYILRTRDDHA